MPAQPVSRYVFGQVPWYSLLVVTGMLLAILLASREEKRLALPRDTAVDLALHVIPLGVIGARLYYVIFAWDTFASQPLSILLIWQGGLAIYGGVLGGILGAWLMSRRKRLSFPLLLDLLAPGVALAQSIGRWGNYFNMEAYGGPVLRPELQFFPLAVLIDGQWRQAAFFYESVWDLAVFLLLWLNRKRKRQEGDIFLWYALLYGAGRLTIESLRADSLLSFAGTLRVSQLLSSLACSAVCAVFIHRAFRAGNMPRYQAILLCLLSVLPAALLFFQPGPLVCLLFSAWLLLLGAAAYDRIGGGAHAHDPR